jgi:N-acetylglucosamine malate deacetylase 1
MDRRHGAGVSGDGGLILHILALGAHPDDLEIYAFGTLSAWAQVGAGLTLAVATDGAKGGALPPDDLRRTRALETGQALAALGTPVFMGFADGELHADARLVRALSDLITACTPDLVVTHAPNDYHADHRALSAAVSQAVGFAAPVLFMDTLNGTGFAPTHWVDVTPHWPDKLAAIRCHTSQDPERFVTIANRQAAFRAGECNTPPDARAEAFRFEPRFPFADIRALLPPAPPLRRVLSRSGDAARNA